MIAPSLRNKGGLPKNVATHPSGVDRPLKMTKAEGNTARKWYEARGITFHPVTYLRTEYFERKYVVAELENSQDKDARRTYMKVFQPRGFSFEDDVAMFPPYVILCEGSNPAHKELAFKLGLPPDKDLIGAPMAEYEKWYEVQCRSVLKRQKANDHQAEGMTSSSRITGKEGDGDIELFPDGMLENPDLYS